MCEMADRSWMPKAVAEALGVSVDTVGRYAREGLIPFATTPKGHRRFDLAEVRDALADLEGPSLARLRPVGRGTGSRLVAGPPVQPSASSTMREQLRATRTTPATARRGASKLAREAQPSPAGALDDMLGHARRVLVATGR
jgi:excisionase family DNA binding protein